MKIAVDIGNTDIVIGIHDSVEWLHNWRTPSKKDVPEATFNEIIKTFFMESEIDLDEIEGVVLSSVVPDLTKIIRNVFETLVGREVVTVGPESIERLSLGKKIDPYQIGSDLVANAIGAFERFHQNAIIVDFGTALTFTSIDSEGQVMGVAISPGVRTAMKSLSTNAAQLPEIPLEIPIGMYGTNTVEAMQAGIMQGYVGLVKHMVNETKTEHNNMPKVIATGGLSFVFKPLHDVFDEIDVNLTLNGLLHIYDRLKPQK